MVTCMDGVTIECVLVPPTGITPSCVLPPALGMISVVFVQEDEVCGHTCEVSKRSFFTLLCVVLRVAGMVAAVGLLLPVTLYCAKIKPLYRALVGRRRFKEMTDMLHRNFEILIS